MARETSLGAIICLYKWQWLMMNSHDLYSTVQAVVMLTIAAAMLSKGISALIFSIFLVVI